jgi:hypothetical protein
MNSDQWIAAICGAIVGVLAVGALLALVDVFVPTPVLHIEDEADANNTRCGLRIGPNLAAPPGPVSVAGMCGAHTCEDCRRALS